jgi:hypothetical protein
LRQGEQSEVTETEETEERKSLHDKTKKSKKLEKKLKLKVSPTQLQIKTGSIVYSKSKQTHDVVFGRRVSREQAEKAKKALF